MKRPASLLFASGMLSLYAQPRYSDADWARLLESLRTNGHAVRTVVRRINPPAEPEALIPTPSHAASSATIQSRIQEHACRFSIEPSLLLAIAEQESNFTQAATGSAGEIGVLQIRPETAVHYRLDPERLEDLDYNIYAGATILSELLRQLGEPRKAVAAYNGGPGYRNSEKVSRYVSEVWKRKEKYDGTPCS